MQKVKIDFLSAGLGNVYRGFEISALVWYSELKNSGTLQARLMSGGTHENSEQIFCIGRNSRLSNHLRKFKLLNDGVKLEQLSFALTLFLKYLNDKPDVVWTQEITVAKTLKRIRNLFGLNYKIFFCDGAPVGYKEASQFDALILLHKAAYTGAINQGADPNRTIYIPHLCLPPKSFISKTDARAKLGLPLDKKIVLSVAAWNRSHKRIDYILEEVKGFGDDYCFLFCGQPEKESAELQDLAREYKIPAIWKTYSQADLSIAYQAADIFVLASLNEGLGAVLIEAGLHKLPIICHHHDGGEFVLGENHEGLHDLSQQGNLKNAIVRLFQTDFEAKGISFQNDILEKFDVPTWKNIFEEYVLKIYSSDVKT